MIEATITEYETVSLAMPAASARALAGHPYAGLTVTPGERDGVWDVRASSRVGVISAGGVRLSVRPKVPIASALALMIDAPPDERWLDEDVPLDESSDLLRLVVHAFAVAIDRGMARGLCREYVEQHEELIGVRGRIDTARIARRPLASAGLPCTFDDFTADTQLNRLLLAAITRSAQVVSLPGADRTLLRRCEAALDGVGRDGDPLAWFDTWVPTRRDAHFARAARLAALILRRLTVADSVGGVLAQAFVVDMNRLVEAFIETRLRIALRGVLDVRGQNGTWLDEDDTVPIKPDLRFLFKGRDLLVADIKYKVVGSLDEASNADIYQAISYASAMGLGDAVLITCGPEREGAKRVTVRHSGIRLHLIPLHLSGGNEQLRLQVKEVAERLAALTFPVATVA